MNCRALSTTRIRKSGRMAAPPAGRPCALKGQGGKDWLVHRLRSGASGPKPAFDRPSNTVRAVRIRPQTRVIVLGTCTAGRTAVCSLRTIPWRSPGSAPGPVQQIGSRRASAPDFAKRKGPGDAISVPAACSDSVCAHAEKVRYSCPGPGPVQLDPAPERATARNQCPEDTRGGRLAAPGPPGPESCGLP